MPEEIFGERTEPATPRKREEARERGHVARSPDLTAAIILFAAVVALNVMGHGIVETVGGLMRRSLESLHEFSVDERDAARMAWHLGAALLQGVVPFMIVVAAAGLLANLLQVGFLFTGEVLAPNLERLDPFAGIGRIFSMQGLVRLAMGLFKLGVLLAVVGFTLWGERVRLMTLGDMAFAPIVGYLTSTALTVAFRAALALLLLGLLDFGFQRLQYERDLRMSRQEIREELKRFEGDPKIRERRRYIQRQLALQRMLGRVPKATVVITNPTELAVALDYDAETMEAPMVVAKGGGFWAERIRHIAGEHGVPIVIKPEVAQALYKSVEVGRTIPAELYKAVAEVLAYVYRLKNVAA